MAGEIVAVGYGVAKHRIGERVVVDYVIHDGTPGGVGYSGGIGSSRQGGYAQYCPVPAENALATSCAWSDAELATLPCAYTTAENMLTQAAVGAGDLVAVTGASGGVGSAMVQLAHLRGARVVALASARKREQVASLGPGAVVATDGDVAAGLAAALGERRLDAVLDVVGGALFTPLLNGLCPLGCYVTAGAIASPIITFDIRTVYLKHLRLIGTSLGTTEGFRAVLDAVETDRIRPLLARTFPLSDIREAHAFFKAKDFFGKLAVVPERED